MSKNLETAIERIIGLVVGATQEEMPELKKIYFNKDGTTKEPDPQFPITRVTSPHFAMCIQAITIGGQIQSDVLDEFERKCPTIWKMFHLELDGPIPDEKIVALLDAEVLVWSKTKHPIFYPDTLLDTLKEP